MQFDHAAILADPSRPQGSMQLTELIDGPYSVAGHPSHAFYKKARDPVNNIEVTAGQFVAGVEMGRGECWDVFFEAPGRESNIQWGFCTAFYKHKADGDSGANYFSVHWWSYRGEWVDGETDDAHLLPIENPVEDLVGFDGSDELPIDQLRYAARGMGIPGNRRLHEGAIKLRLGLAGCKLI